MRRALVVLVALVALVTLVLAACSPPESNRERGGGPGADPGNHGDPIVIHERRDPFQGTPRKE